MIYDCMSETWISTNEETTMNITQYECIEPLTFQLGSCEFETFGSVLEISVRVYAEHDLSMHCELNDFTIFGETHQFKRGCPLTKIIEGIMQREMTDEVLDMIRDSNPAFIGMPSQHDQWRLDERTY